MNIRKWKISRELLWIDNTISHISLFDFNTKWTIINSNVSVPLLRCLNACSLVDQLCCVFFYCFSEHKFMFKVETVRSKVPDRWTIANHYCYTIEHIVHHIARWNEQQIGKINSIYCVWVWLAVSQSLEFILNFAFSMESKNSQERPINT